MNEAVATFIAQNERVMSEARQRIIDIREGQWDEIITALQSQGLGTSRQQMVQVALDDIKQLERANELIQSLVIA